MVGRLLLGAAPVGAVVWAAASIAGRRQRRWLIAAAWSTAALLVAATIRLALSLVRLDPALTYVAANASRATPNWYRLAATWGGMNGSLLFWAALLAVLGATMVTILHARQSALLPIASLVSASTVAAYSLVSRLTADPFERLRVPTGSGQGLLAVLQHPAMVYHPPLLYLGLTMLLPPFAVTVAAAWRRALDDDWLAVVLPWLRASWAVSAAGMLAGSHWAYMELGWGGFWAWDPVENTALLPWLLATIALHTATVTARTGRTAPTTAVAVILSFVVVTMGAYATRSGGTGSIHAFAVDDDVGRGLLTIAVLVIVVAVAAMWRVTPTRWRLRPLAGREAGIAVHVAVLGLAALAIGVGTFYPVATELIGERRAAVTAGYYERILVPLVLVVLFAAALVPRLRWSGGVREARRAIIGASIGASIGVLLLWWFTPSSGETASAVVVTGSAAAGVATADIAAGLARATRRWRAVGVALAHLGFATVMVGAAASSLGGEATERLAIGTPVSFGDRTLELVQLATGEEPRYAYVEATIEVRDGDDRHVARPQLRAYEAQSVPASEASVRSTPSGDLMVVLESVDDTLDGARVAIYDRPLQAWTWWGTLVMLAGGLLAAFGGRRWIAADGAGGSPPQSARAAPPPRATMVAGSPRSVLPRVPPDRAPGRP